jgi:hypothetical protein
MKSIVQDPHRKWLDSAAGTIVFLAIIALVVFLAYQLVDLSARMISHSASQTAVVHDAIRLAPESD